MKLDKISKALLSMVMTQKKGQALELMLQNFCQQAKDGKKELKYFLGDYAWYGDSSLHQAYALQLLAESVILGENDFLFYFQRYLDLLQTPYYQRLCEMANCAESKPNSPELVGYFSEILKHFTRMVCHSFEGYLNIKGQEAYLFIIDLIADAQLPFIIRILAKDALLKHSKSAVIKNYNCSEGCGPSNAKNYWLCKKDDDGLPVKFLKKWASEGFPNPKEKPKKVLKRATALDHPMTPLENLCSRLEKSLHAALALRPTDIVFIEADGNDLADVKRLESEWNIKLPTLYLEFFERFSPLCAFDLSSNTTTENNKEAFEEDEDEFEEDGYYIMLANAGNFNKLQDGYGIVRGERNPRWPSHHIVVGELEPCSFGPIVFIMDLSKSNGDDAPIFCDIHDGPYKIPIADSFLAFLEKIVLQKGWEALIHTIKTC